MGKERDWRAAGLMPRLHILAEGQTEEAFVNRVLSPHLADFSVFVDVRCLSTKRGAKRKRSNSGGILPYHQTKADVLRWINEDGNEDSWHSTMFDLYALPADSPGFQEAQLKIDALERVGILETAFKSDIPYRRFIPYIQLHEFEALLFSDPTEFGREFLEQHSAIANLVDIAAAAESPEHIDDTPQGAPSKRIIDKIPEYEGRKVSAGPIIARAIGLQKIREKCVHFAAWLTTLENLGTDNGREQ